MAIRNPKIFGLNVLSFLSDVESKTSALKELNLNPLDLEIIAGSADAGASRHDWISFSRLSVPLHETLDRYYRDSEQYDGILQKRAGTDVTLFGNLNISGTLSGFAIRYRYLDGFGGSATIRIADISTSRISAWSSSDPRATSTDLTIQGKARISYGARTTIISGGSLQFGTQSAEISGPRIQTAIVPQQKEFPSEFPTSKIQCNIGGQTVTLYAMKGIPVIFTGFFRNLNATVNLDRLIKSTPASWKIVETANESRYSKYVNVGNTTSTIRYRSSTSRERYIQFYYNPDRISRIQIQSANISELPIVKFINASTLDFAYNKLRTLPNFNTIAPNLLYIYLMRNPLYQSDIESERRFSTDVANKFPTSLRELYMEGTFYGSIDQNIIANRFPNLRVINFNRGGGAYFHPDTYQPSAQIPNVPNTCTYYGVGSNDFRSIDNTASGSGNTYNVKQLTNLSTLYLAGNYYLSDSTFSISANNNSITNIYIHSTALKFPENTIGKQSLQIFYAYYCRSLGSLFSGSTYRFDNCGSLRYLHCYASYVTGALPRFTNESLYYLDLRYTYITGGDPSGDTSYVIPENTFKDLKSIYYILLDSGYLLTSPIHPNCLTFCSSLYYFWYRSRGRTTGSLPNFGSNPNLRYIWMYHNRFSGSVPNFAANPNIFYVQLGYNQLTGQIPSYKNLSNLYYLFLYNNRFTSIGTFQNLPRLRYFYAHNNQIAGEIPDFTECPYLYYLILYNNRFTNYKQGSFKELYRIRYMDISNNSLTQQAIEQIINDLVDNYEEVNRGGVTINLRNNSAPNEGTLEKIAFLRSKGWNITHS
jgi:hypothetical protein